MISFRRISKKSLASTFGAACFAAAMVLVMPAQAKAEAEPEFLTPHVFADIAEKTLPSVVSVYVKHDIQEQLASFRERMEPFKEFFDDPQWRRFFREPGEGEGADPHADSPESRTSGSGVIINSDGYIVTNNHIVQGAKEGTISVVLNDDTEIPPEKVKLLATDELLDLAVLKVDPVGLDLHPIRWGNSDEMRIGDWVLAIGNPLDLRGSVSKGIVSAKTRKIGKVPIEHLIQTDAMINPGNSGGALVNLQGELIGINMAIATNSGFFQGIGFAIPSNDAKFITEQVIKDGRIRRGYIGIYMKAVEEDAALRSALGLKEGSGGILVEDVVAGAPAAEAGVQPFDVITKVDGFEVEDNGDLLGLIAGKRVGDTAKLTIMRDVDGDVKEVELRMKVTERPSNEQLIQRLQPIPQPEESEPEPEKPSIGISVKPYSQGDMKGLEVTAVEPNSPAARAGILVGDVILEINREAVGNPRDLERIVRENTDGKSLLVRYLNRVEGRTMIIAVPAPETK